MERRRLSRQLRVSRYGELQGSLATAAIIDIITQKIAAVRWIYVH